MGRRVCLWWSIIQVETRMCFTTLLSRHRPRNWNKRRFVSSTWIFYFLISHWWLLFGFRVHQLLSIIIHLISLCNAIFFFRSKIIWWRGVRFGYYINWNLLLITSLYKTQEMLLKISIRCYTKRMKFKNERKTSDRVHQPDWKSSEISSQASYQYQQAVWHYMHARKCRKLRAENSKNMWSLTYLARKTSFS